MRQKDCHEYQQWLGGVLHWLTHLSHPNALVVDPFGGGFTTAVACALTGRRFTGGDFDRENVHVGLHRLNNLHDEKERLTEDERAKYGL